MFKREEVRKTQPPFLASSMAEGIRHGRHRPQKLGELREWPRVTRKGRRPQTTKAQEDLIPAL